MFADTPIWVPHICPKPALSERRAARGESNGLADVGKAEGPVSDLPSPVPFFPINADVFVTNAAACVTNAAVCVTNTAESHLTCSQPLPMLSSSPTQSNFFRINHRQKPPQGEGGGVHIKRKYRALRMLLEPLLHPCLLYTSRCV